MGLTQARGLEGLRPSKRFPPTLLCLSPLAINPRVFCLKIGYVLERRACYTQSGFSSPDNQRTEWTFMHRLAVSLSAFALIFVMMVNIALFVQNNQLRKQTIALPAQLQPTQ